MTAFIRRLAADAGAVGGPPPPPGGPVGVWPGKRGPLVGSTGSTRLRFFGSFALAYKKKETFYGFN